MQSFILLTSTKEKRNLKLQIAAIGKGKEVTGN